MARFNGGWIKLWRRAVEGDLADNVFLWGLWNWLLFAAHWKPSSIIWKGVRRDIPAGTVVLGMTELAEKWDCSKTTIKKWLDYLESSERIHMETCSRGTLITIRNWDVYQSPYAEACSPSDGGVAAGCPPGVRQVTLSEEGKKERRERGDGFTPENLAEAEATWVKTLAKFGIDKPADFDRDQIIRLIQRYGFEKTNMALLGAGFEEKGGDFDPSNHVNIRRLTDKPAIFDKFVNLGAKNKPTEEKVTEWKVKL